MFDYAVRALHMSESEADLRIKAARIGPQFPDALEMLARGKLHMTALRLLAPVLTESNVYLLKEACFKSKQEVRELIAKHFPSPDVADSMRRLPQPRSIPTGQQPQPAVLSSLNSADLLQLAMDPLQLPSQLASSQQHNSVQPSGAPMLAPAPSSLANNKPAVTVPLSEGRYKVQFTASQSLYDMLKEARDLCCDQVPNGAIATIVEQALILLIAHKKKQRFAQTSRPRKQWLPRTGAYSSSKKSDEEYVSKRPAEGPLNRAREAERPLGKHDASKPDDSRREAERPLGKGDASKSGRYIPSALRREVYARDGGQCSFVSKNGTRCGSRRDLEFHHVVPFARGGAMTRDNLSLICRPHNALFAERDYGRDYVKSRVAKRRDQTGSYGTTEPGQDRMTREPARSALHVPEQLTDAATSRSSVHECDQSNQCATEQSHPVQTG
ncbi:MAG TPA: HNH endonuclease [Polyangiales bacterium]|nr:HNH endonuclease [Polyangiales bacterium]